MRDFDTSTLRKVHSPTIRTYACRRNQDRSRRGMPLRSPGCDQTTIGGRHFWRRREKTSAGGTFSISSLGDNEALTVGRISASSYDSDPSWNAMEISSTRYWKTLAKRTSVFRDTAVEASGAVSESGLAGCRSLPRRDRSVTAQGLQFCASRNATCASGWFRSFAPAWSRLQPQKKKKRLERWFTSRLRLVSVAGGGRHSPSIQSVVHVILTVRPDYPWATTL